MKKQIGDEYEVFAKLLMIGLLVWFCLFGGFIIIQLIREYK